ncbi:MAG: HAMP domain-containing protein [Anaerolineae bacterium]
MSLNENPLNPNEDPPEKNRYYLSLLGRILIPSLISGLVPLLLIGMIALRGYRTASNSAQESATAALNQESLEALEIQADLIANDITTLLNQAVQDSQSLAIINPNIENYVRFYAGRNSTIQYPLSDSRSIVENIPLYREVAFLDLNGQELFKIIDGEVVDPRILQDVSQPENTTFKTENYFEQSRNLAPGRIYVSEVTTWHAGQARQPGNTLNVNRVVGSQFGKYEAVIRFVTPYINDAGETEGLIVLSLDHRHIIEKSIHVSPTKPGRNLWADYRSGNYAVLFDHEGYTIAHPRLNRIRGLDQDGQLIPYWTEDASPNEEEKLAFNWAHAGHKNENFPEAYEAVLAKKEGYTTRINNKGVTIVTVYTPIVFDYGVYAESGVFGGVTIGAGLEQFNKAANTVGVMIRNEQRGLQNNLVYLSILGGFLLISASILIARSVTGPIRLLTEVARRLEDGVLEVDMLDAISGRTWQDEVGTLAIVFKNMGRKVQSREKRLRETVSKLKIEIDQQKSQQKVQEIIESDFFKGLEKEANKMRERRDRKIGERTL